MGTAEFLVPPIPNKVQDPNFRSAVSAGAYVCVRFSASGYFGLAQASHQSNVPCIGILTANIASGVTGRFQTLGPVVNSGWNFSGYTGANIFLGTSSEVTLTPPSASGFIVQRVGQVHSQDTIQFVPETWFTIIGQ